MKLLIDIGNTATKFGYLDDKEVEAIALSQEPVKKHIEGKTIKKIIVVKNKIVNIVAI